MDPLIVFSRFIDIPEMIFQHFTGEDLLQFAKINANWREFCINELQKLKVCSDFSASI